MSARRFRSHVYGAGGRTLTPFEEVEILRGLARKRIDQGQMVAALRRATPTAVRNARPCLRGYGYGEALAQYDAAPDGAVEEAG